MRGDAIRGRFWSNRRNGDPLFRHPELVLGFRVQNQCILCGDGMGHAKRECQLHPGICDVCEQEYCECMATEQVVLRPLEEIARLHEDDQIEPLLARKLTLRAAGKETNSLPAIPLSPTPDTVYVPFRTRKLMPEDTNPSFENIQKVLEEQGEADRINA
jgi:hypothetical protein